MVNSGSFDSGDGNRNDKIRCTQAGDAALGSQPSSDSDDAACKSDCSKSADGDLPSDESAIEPTPTKTEINSNMPSNVHLKCESFGNDGIGLASLSLPLEKIQSAPNINSPDNTEDKVKQARKLLCLYCDRSFVSANLRQKHVERVHSVKHLRRVSARRQNQLSTTPCAHCDKLNSSEHTLSDLFQHLVQEHPTKYFGCLTCEEKFLTSVDLADHNRLKHSTNQTSFSTNLLTSQNENVVGPSSSTDFTQKVTRSKLRYSTGELGADDVSNFARRKRKSKLKELRNKKISVKSSKIAIKRSKRLQQQAKEVDVQKKRREKKLPTSNKLEVASNTKQPEKSKTACVNPFPEFDHFYRVKKITDHSIDNLKISSLTFDDVFDKAFFNRIKCNIEENLLHHIDGKLFKNEESESRISNFEKVSTGTQEVPNPNADNYGCEISLNAITPASSLSLNSQFGEDFESQIEYGSKPSKKKTQIKSDEVHYKYFTRRKYQASILQQKENRDLSKLDMWTQMLVKDRQERVVNKKKSAKEIQEYTTCQEYRSKMKREELNRILDRRGPFEDLKEEASKKAAFDKLNSSSDNNVSQEVFTHVREVLNDLLNRVFEAVAEDDGPLEESFKEIDHREIPAYLDLRRKTSSTQEEIDKSDRIALICSSQETENFELPTNTVRSKNELVELTGEWARSRMYICAACGGKFSNMRYLIEHKGIYHQNVWVQHYEFVGNQGELYRHLSIPGLGKVGIVEETVPCKLWKRSDARTCTKCGKQCNALGELHRHVLECGGDWTWMLARKKCKYRPFGAKTRRKLRGFEPRIHNRRKTEPSEKKKYKKPIEGPRQRPSDADTIQRMLANLPAKRSRRSIISLSDVVFKSRKRNNSTNAKKHSATKVNCGKALRKKQPADSNTHTSSQQRSSRTLRSFNKVLSSRILDLNSSLMVKRKIKVLRNHRLTRKRGRPPKNNAVDTIEETTTDEGLEASTAEITQTQKKRKSPKKEAASSCKEPKKCETQAQDVASLNTHKSVAKRMLNTRLNLKNFFPVKKKSLRQVQKNSEADKISTDYNFDSPISTENNDFDKNSKYLDNFQHMKKNKRGGLKGFVRALSLRKRNSKEEEEASAINNADNSISKNNQIPIRTDTSKKIIRSKVEQKGDEDNSKSTPNSDSVSSEILSKKRKLQRSFRNVINKVKKIKTENTHVKKSKKENLEKPFLEEGAMQKDSPPPEKLVTHVEAKESIQGKNDLVPTVSSNSSDSKENPPIPETIFNLTTSEEKNLQAKGELDFDIKHQGSITDTGVCPSNFPLISEENKTNSVHLDLDSKISPVAIDTSLKPKCVPLVSPNIKGKIRKPSRGLNDCIAMLTSKLQQKEDKMSSSLESLFSTSSTTSTEPRPERPILDSIAVPKILPKPENVPKLSVLNDKNSSLAEETALDLSKKSVSTPNLLLSNPDLEHVPENKNEDLTSNNRMPPTWNSVDDIIQQVVHDSSLYIFNKPKKNSFMTRSKVDDTIDFVVSSSLDWFKTKHSNAENNVKHQKKTKRKKHFDDNLITNIIFGKDKLIIAPSSDPKSDFESPLIAKIKENEYRMSHLLSSSSNVETPVNQKNKTPNILDISSAADKNIFDSSSTPQNDASQQLDQKEAVKSTVMKQDIISAIVVKEDTSLESQNCPKDAKLNRPDKNEVTLVESTTGLCESHGKSASNNDSEISAQVEQNEKATVLESTKVDPVKSTSKKLRKIATKSQKKNEKPVIETDLDNYMNIKEVITDNEDKITQLNISSPKNIDGKPKKIELITESEPILLENKAIQKPLKPVSDSEDEIPLAVFAKINDSDLTKPNNKKIVKSSVSETKKCRNNVKQRNAVETVKTNVGTTNPSNDNKDMVETLTTDSLKENIEEATNIKDELLKKANKSIADHTQISKILKRGRRKKRRKLLIRNKKRLPLKRNAIIRVNNCTSLQVQADSILSAAVKNKDLPFEELSKNICYPAVPEVPNQEQHNTNTEHPADTESKTPGCNSQRTRRKSKSSKKIDKTENDLFKNFSLVINKKTKRIPPTSIVDDSVCDDILDASINFFVKPSEVSSKETDAEGNIDTPLNDSVEEMDMEIEDIPINTNIIERGDVQFACFEDVKFITNDGQEPSNLGKQQDCFKESNTGFIEFRKVELNCMLPEGEQTTTNTNTIEKNYLSTSLENVGMNDKCPLPFQVINLKPIETVIAQKELLDPVKAKEAEDDIKQPLICKTENVSSCQVEELIQFSDKTGLSKGSMLSEEGPVVDAKIIQEPKGNLENDLCDDINKEEDVLSCKNTENGQEADHEGQVNGSRMNFQTKSLRLLKVDGSTSLLEKPTNKSSVEEETKLPTKSSDEESFNKTCFQGNNVHKPHSYPDSSILLQPILSEMETTPSPAISTQVDNSANKSSLFEFERPLNESTPKKKRGRPRKKKLNENDAQGGTCEHPPHSFDNKNNISQLLCPKESVATNVIIPANKNVRKASSKTQRRRSPRSKSAPTKDQSSEILDVNSFSQGLIESKNGFSSDKDVASILESDISVEKSVGKLRGRQKNKKESNKSLIEPVLSAECPNTRTEPSDCVKLQDNNVASPQSLPKMSQSESNVNECPNILANPPLYTSNNVFEKTELEEMSGNTNLCEETKLCHEPAELQMNNKLASDTVRSEVKTNRGQKSQCSNETSEKCHSPEAKTDYVNSKNNESSTSKCLDNEPEIVNIVEAADSTSLNQVLNDVEKIMEDSGFVEKIPSKKQKAKKPKKDIKTKNGPRIGNVSIKKSTTNGKKVFSAYLMVDDYSKPEVEETSAPISDTKTICEYNEAAIKATVVCSSTVLRKPVETDTTLQHTDGELVEKSTLSQEINIEMSLTKPQEEKTHQDEDLVATVQLNVETISENSPKSSIVKNNVIKRVKLGRKLKKMRKKNSVGNDDVVQHLVSHTVLSLDQPKQLNLASSPDGDVKFNRDEEDPSVFTPLYACNVNDTVLTEEGSINTTTVDEEHNCDKTLTDSNKTNENLDKIEEKTVTAEFNHKVHFRLKSNHIRHRRRKSNKGTQLDGTLMSPNSDSSTCSDMVLKSRRPRKIIDYNEDNLEKRALEANKSLATQNSKTKKERKSKKNDVNLETFSEKDISEHSNKTANIHSDMDNELIKESDVASKTEDLELKSTYKETISHINTENINTDLNLECNAVLNTDEEFDKAAELVEMPPASSESLVCSMISFVAESNEGKNDTKCWGTEPVAFKATDFPELPKLVVDIHHADQIEHKLQEHLVNTNEVRSDIPDLVETTSTSGIQAETSEKNQVTLQNQHGTDSGHLDEMRVQPGDEYKESIPSKINANIKKRNKKSRKEVAIDDLEDNVIWNNSLTKTDLPINETDSKEKKLKDDADAMSKSTNYVGSEDFVGTFKTINGEIESEDKNEDTRLVEKPVALEYQTSNEILSNDIENEDRSALSRYNRRPRKSINYNEEVLLNTAESVSKNAVATKRKRKSISTLNHVDGESHTENSMAQDKVENQVNGNICNLEQDAKTGQNLDTSFEQIPENKGKTKKNRKKRDVALSSENLSNVSDAYDICDFKEGKTQEQTNSFLKSRKKGSKNEWNPQTQESLPLCTEEKAISKISVSEVDLLSNIFEVNTREEHAIRTSDSAKSLDAKDTVDLERPEENISLTSNPLVNDRSKIFNENNTDIHYASSVLDLESASRNRRTSKKGQALVDDIMESSREIVTSTGLQENYVSKSADNRGEVSPNGNNHSLDENSENGNNNEISQSCMVEHAENNECNSVLKPHALENHLSGSNESLPLLGRINSLENKIDIEDNESVHSPENILPLNGTNISSNGVLDVINSVKDYSSSPDNSLVIDDRELPLSLNNLLPDNMEEVVLEHKSSPTKRKKRRKTIKNKLGKNKFHKISKQNKIIKQPKAINCVDNDSEHPERQCQLAKINIKNLLLSSLAAPDSKYMESKFIPSDSNHTKVEDGFSKLTAGSNELNVIESVNNAEISLNSKRVDTETFGGTFQDNINFVHNNKSLLNESLTFTALKDVLNTFTNSCKTNAFTKSDSMFSEIQPLSEIITSSEMDIAPVLDEIDKSLECDDVYDFSEDIQGESYTNDKQKSTKNKSKNKSKLQITEEVELKRTSSRSAKVKALESIHEKVLTESQETEQNITSAHSKKSKKRSKSLNESKKVEGTEKNLATEKSDKVFEEVTTRNVPHELNLKNESHENKPTPIEDAVTDSRPPEFSMEVHESNQNVDNSEEDKTGHNQLDEDAAELRRSRRGSRKIPSYNENDLIDPLIDALEKRRSRSSRKDRSTEKHHIKTDSSKESGDKPKLSSEELFDLLKNSSFENENVSKPSKSFVDNMNEHNSSGAYQEKAEDGLEKSTPKAPFIEPPKLKDVDKIYEFTEDSPENTEEIKELFSKNKKKPRQQSLTDEIKISADMPGCIEISTSVGLHEIKSLDKESNDPDQEKSNYCEICKKSFIRVENLIKHKTTLTHISKLSELEAKAAEEKAKLEKQPTRERSTSPSKATEDLKDEINLTDILQHSERPQVSVQEDSAPLHNNHSLKLVDIINDVLNKPVIGNYSPDKQEFSSCHLQNKTKSDVRRYKSLGERKSFESENQLVQINAGLPNSYLPPALSQTSILENQINLLENIIGNNLENITSNKHEEGNNYIDEISSCSNASNTSDLDNNSCITSRSVVNVNSEINCDADFIKPTQYEEISEDSTNARVYEDPKQRKTLNRDEELFLECCSLLKSGSEVSNSNYSKNMKKPLDCLKEFDEPDLMENKKLIQTAEEAHEYCDNSRTPTPLGDTYDDEASNSNTISSNWHLKSEKPMDKNRSFSFEEVKSKEAAGMPFGEILTKGLRNQFEYVSKTNERSSDDGQDLLEKNLPNDDRKDDSDCSTASKKVATKGARKVYEGLKVSIPTEDLDLEVLNSSPLNKKSDVKTDPVPEEYIEQTPSKPRSTRKSKPVKKSQVGSNLLFKVNKKKSSPQLVDSTPAEQQDIYNFEETQDNTDIFIKPTLKDFNSTEPEVKKDNILCSDNDSLGYADSIGADAKSVSSVSSVSAMSMKKPEIAPENITKKKYKIMGKIFRNAAKSKMDDIDEELRSIPEIPEIDNLELVENYVRSCQRVKSPFLPPPPPPPIDDLPKKPKMTEEEMNMLFDQLLGKEVNESKPERTINKSVPKVKNGDIKKKNGKVKNRKRARGHSESSDDEFNINRAAKKRSNKKNNQEDSGINLELELKECIGVASRKSQRTCTSGKQNILLEYWSSDEEAFEAMLESHKISSRKDEDKKKSEKRKAEVEEIPKKNTPGSEIFEKPSETAAVKQKPAKKKKSPLKKSKPLSTKVSEVNDASAAATNRRKRAAVNPLYHWSSSSEDESQSLIEVKPIREEDDEDDRPIQHGWIVGDSPKKLVTMLALTKGKKTDIDCVKEQGKRRTSNIAS